MIFEPTQRVCLEYSFLFKRRGSSFTLLQEPDFMISLNQEWLGQERGYRITDTIYFEKASP